jgi:hypothetical protein
MCFFWLVFLQARTGGEVVRQGWLHRSVGKSSWKKSWVVVKYKYMYYYSNPDVRHISPSLSHP